MVDAIPQSVKNAWEKWNIRGVILFSLSLQVFLILFAPFRKCSANKILILLIWSGYLLADWAANFTVGLISNSQNDNCSSKSIRNVTSASNNTGNGELLAFWAPFLLLHLGGPDTITAFALEDNELWLRHLLSLIFQAIAGVYVFIQSIPNRLYVAVILLFIAGIIKYVERTRALYLASLDKFRDAMIKKPDPGPNYAKLMEEYASKKDAELPTQIIMIPEPDKESKPPRNVKKGDLTELEIVQYAHSFYKTFRGLVVDLIFSFRERDESREFFDKRSPGDALRIIEVELNFIYEALYTKVEVLHSYSGNVFRFIAFISLCSAFFVFHYTIEKHEFDSFDVGITYTLLIGGISLDLIATIMFIFSDWTFAMRKRYDDDSDTRNKWAKMLDSFLCKLLSAKRPWWFKCKAKDSYVEHELIETPLLLRRWSGKIAAHNLIGYCLKNRPKDIFVKKNWIFRGIISFFHWMNNSSKVFKIFFLIVGFPFYLLAELFKLLGKLLLRLFKSLAWLDPPFKTMYKLLAFLGSQLIEFFGLKHLVDGIRFISHGPFTKELWEFIFNELHRKSLFADDPETAKRISSARGEWVLQDSSKNINHSKLMPYVSDVDYDQSLLLWHIATELCYQTEEETKENANERQFSKLLSDYMLYLLVMQPTMMSAVAGIGKIRFRDTCAEAEKFFERRHMKANDDEKEACNHILEVNTDVLPNAVKGDRSKSVLFDASMLAKELKTNHENDKWNILSQVWVELLSYSASHCDAKTHAQQISKGGELISFVWLLMAHFGLGEQFQINEGHARAKLIVGK